MAPLSLPLIAPCSPRLSTMSADLLRVEASGIYSNFGPEVRALEAEATARLFGGEGATLTVGNATLGLMLALCDATGGRRDGRYALMPALTFAATAQAAWWAGLTPLVCDVDPDDWSACARAEEALLQRHGERIAAIVPYATFGRAIDLDRYARVRDRHDVAVVVDAAASLGTQDAAGRQFGSGAPFPIVFSMHATKPFAVAEGGLIHCGDRDTIERLRTAAHFGFGAPRTATTAGLNAKLPEVLAVMARAKLAGFDAVRGVRGAVAAAYRDAVEGRYPMQPADPGQIHGFLPLLLPADRAAARDRIVAGLAEDGIGAASYFSPHLGQHPWMRDHAMIDATPVADDLAARLLSLPVTDTMTPADAHRVIAALDRAVARARALHAVPAGPAGPAVAETLLIGGGPAGTAMLTAASRNGVLPRLAAGLVVVEAGAQMGSGRLGRYAITSDSTADTFLSALAGNPHRDIATLVEHPAATAVARHRDALGVPLTTVGPLLDAVGRRLGELVTANGGTLLTGHTATEAWRTEEGLWRVRLVRADGHEHERLARRLVLATGGHQPLDALAMQDVGGAPLATLAQGRLVLSDAVLASGGVEMVADLVAGLRAPRIAVVGGSTSALTTVAALLKTRLPLGAGAVTLLHRRPLRPFYPSAEAALADGYDGFGADDICPVSGFVHRLAGFRLEARELVLRMLGIGGRAADPRVALHRLGNGTDAAARQIVRDADVVIAALGYRPRALPLFRLGGAALVLAAEAGGALVDPHCRLRAQDGTIVPDAWGIGLAAGFVPWGRLGGEPSFRGQANGLWLWQNDVGMMIVDQLLGAAASEAA